MKKIRMHFRKYDMNEDLPNFRDLHESMLAYEGPALFDDVLVPWLPQAAIAIKALLPYQRLNTPQNTYPVPQEDLEQWFALNVVNDFLLLRFQRSPDFYAPPPPRGVSQWLDRKYREWVEERRRWEGPALESSGYELFFETLGFQVFTPGVFTPFHCEIVEVIEDGDWQQEPRVEYVYWPCVKFGEMLFSRAGVRVRCGAGVFIKAIAENSTLYFTNRRYRRLVEDLSHGWGSNSRWRTDFRRDYETDTHFHYNVDRKYVLGSPPDASVASSKRHDLETLTLAEQTELLTHRCFVHCGKDDINRWPYDDRLTVSKSFSNEQGSVSGLEI